jgi:DNA-directed RNA polymerase subunit K/omega
MAFMHRSLQKFMMSHRAGARARQRALATSFAAPQQPWRHTPLQVALHLPLFSPKIA